MNTGLLWFDNDPKIELALKIQKAAEYYRKKYGQNPNLCFVHPTMVGDQNPHPGKIEVRTNRSILPNHFWIGMQASHASILGK
jgi:hypothetical protein